ncbi:hypothetical protein HYX02_08300 [Candidatus Woesearchaeota archaeon]|nr:hypothetical protein [Candidatus Woesearchaeota archaeon]
MKRGYFKDIKTYFLTYVLFSVGVLFIVAQSGSGDGFYGNIGGGLMWFIFWLILNGVYGYKIKEKLQPKYKERITIGSFLLFHTTSSFVYSLLGYIYDPELELLFMAFTVYFLLGLLFAGISFSVGVKLASRKKSHS